ncbi:MAG: glutathione peroxidase [Epsilonproteobacteria bacterium]|nr:glutathione peroxidase [Campylobacterota bacterium]
MFKLLLILITTYTLNAGAPMQKHFYDFEAKNIKGETISMSQYKGKVVLVVNVASECGFTPQYEGLEKMYKTYKAQGFEILAFPCNQFGEQEPGSAEEIQKFCSSKFSVTFPLFEKIDVNGDNTHPLYVFLKSKATGFLGTESIKWNFTKFLINKEGKVIDRYGSATKPAKITEDIEKLL